MARQRRYAITVTIVRPAGRNRTGDPKPATEFDIEQCFWFPAGSTETETFSDQVITGRTLYIPTNGSIPDVRSTDQVRLPDGPDLWYILGDPPSSVVTSPTTGKRSPMVVRLSRTKG